MAFNTNGATSGAISGATAGSALGPVGMAVGGIAGGLLGGFNDDGSTSAFKQYKYQKKLQKQQQDWEERMANTAHQREVADLEAAGLNKVLSVNGGAPTPSMSAGQAQMEPTAPYNPLQALELALTAKQANADIENKKAQTENIKADTANKEQTHELTPDIVKATINLNKANTGKAKNETLKIAQETYTEKLRQYKMQLENQMSDMDLAKRKAFYKEEMTAYVLNLKKEIARAGLESNELYQIIDHAFETVGKVWGASTNTSTSTSTHTGKSQVNINKN